MYNYDPKSLKAEEFINHEEIEETLRYAEENKHNAELIDSILEKAKLRKGLSHREAEVLLDCDIPEKNEEIYKLAEQIKKIRNRIGIAGGVERVKAVKGAIAGGYINILITNNECAEKLL